MKGKFLDLEPDSIGRGPRALVFLVLGLMLAGTCAAGSASAQTSPAQTNAPATGDAAATPLPDPSETRIAHARALAAAHKLAAAALELDSIRTTATDESVRDVARIMLMNIYLEEGDYSRADALLGDTFKARSPAQESSVQSYFALAGQTINGARHHLERYREFGINIADRSLPPEAQSDLERLRQLLELIATQAGQMSQENNKNTDAIALLEDVAGVRATLARDDDDRQRWQQEFANARQRLAASETRIASISPGLPPRQPSGGNATLAANARPGSNPSTASSPSSTTSANNRRSNAARPNSSASTRSSGGSNSGGNGSNASNASGASNTAAAPAQPSPSSAESTARRSDGGAGGAGDGAASSPASGSSTTTGASAQPMDVGSLLDKARQKVNPLYPATARNVHITGVVTVYLVVDENGAVEAVQRTSGPQMLRQAAVDAAKRWKFHPTVVDGQPVRVAGYISFNFTL